MNTLASLLLLFATINFVLSDGLTRDIQQTEGKIGAELSQIQEDIAEEAIVRSVIGGSPGGDGLTRDIQREEAQINRDLARIQVDATEERIVQQAVRGGGGYNGGAGGYYGRAGGYNNGGSWNQQWGRR
jgi:hypothetical protein